MKKILIEEVTNTLQKSIPIWFMRQAGRYLEEYRNEKKRHNSFLDMCLNSNSMKEITIQPLKRFNLDAAIIFSDILIVPYAMGLNVEFIKEVGPVFSEKNIDKRVSKLEEINSNTNIYSKVYEGISKVKEEIDNNYRDKTIIGFAGAPFTIACYVIQGKGSRDFNEVKKFYFNNKIRFLNVINIIKRETINYLKGQIDQGVEVIKLFDSWAGILAEEDFNELVIEVTEDIVNELRNYKKDIIINAFPKGAGVKYKSFIDRVRPEIIAIDHTVPKIWARDNLQKESVIQGNLDNVILCSKTEDLKNKVIKILDTFSKGRFIFNLGHGILPETKIEKIEELIKIVKSYVR